MTKVDEKWVLSATRAAESGQLAYQNWFDGASSLERVRAQSCVDFFGKILTTDVLERIGDPSEQSALEIGSGGGRLLGCAAQTFKRAVGVDLVYEDQRLVEMTRALHVSWGVSGCEMIPPRGLLDLEPDSFGFIYSFIAFQHFDSEQVVFNYMRSARRLIRSGGMARLFVGRSETEDIVRLIDEPFDPNDLQFDSTLQMPPGAFRAIAEATGFRVVNVIERARKQPWIDMPSSQMMFDLVAAGPAH